MSEDPGAFAPELIMLGGAVLTLLTGSFLPRTRQWIVQLLAALTLAGALASAALAGTGGPRTVYEGSFALDVGTFAARLIIPAAALLCIGLATARVRGNPRESEFYVLVLLASLGSMVLAGSSDLLLLAVGYLLASIPLYALAGWGRDPAGAEGALKTYLLGAVLGIVMLGGIAVLSGVTGASTYAALADRLPAAPPAAVAVGVVAVLAGLLFKIGAVPAHFWVPDAVAGATTLAGAFLTTVPKIGALIATYRLLLVIPEDAVHWRLLIAVIAAASMTLGNFAAFTQDDPLRLLAYSTISQVGYLLMTLTVAGHGAPLGALLLYLAGYAATNLGAFAVVAALPARRTLGDYRGLARTHPALAAVLVVCLLGLVGTPPTAVFTGKLAVFTATWDAGWAWLVIVAALNTLASLYYYLRWIAPTFASRRGIHPKTTPRGAAPAGRRWVTGTALTAGTASLVLGPAAGLLLTAATGPLSR